MAHTLRRCNFDADEEVDLFGHQGFSDDDDDDSDEEAHNKGDKNGKASLKDEDSESVFNAKQFQKLSSGYETDEYDASCPENKSLENSLSLPETIRDISVANAENTNSYQDKATGLNRNIKGPGFETVEEELAPKLGDKESSPIDTDIENSLVNKIEKLVISGSKYGASRPGLKKKYSEVYKFPVKQNTVESRGQKHLYLVSRSPGYFQHEKRFPSPEEDSKCCKPFRFRADEEPDTHPQISVTEVEGEDIWLHDRYEEIESMGEQRPVYRRKFEAMNASRGNFYKHARTNRRAPRGTRYTRRGNYRNPRNSRIIARNRQFHDFRESNNGANDSFN